ncbi:hypothetical protein J3R30DRAFT_3694398 [Lentinula aciculospora]|uniref:Golgi apparatus membrane protein TVP38 n=1 Tax=Lentinula aciculospora TaxID=153920 RepID=A0A9W9AU83_9AGAR|nr:hypothetical protein J3R30DRAFT_3694398 [Lentinula aciculospora]
MSFPETYRLVDSRGQPVTHEHHESFSGQQLYDNNPYRPPQYEGYKPPELDERFTPQTYAPVHVNLQETRAQVARTPSPTPSESRALAEIGNHSGLINWNRIKSKDFWLSKDGLKYGITAAVVITLVVLFAIYHEDIVVFLTPATQWCHDHKFGWLIPVGLLVVLSFPPLFGHEIVGMLCGIGWGIGLGFAIVALGTILGELANFFTFKYCCTARAQKYEKKKLTYAALARVVRTGGFKIALAARLSLIPPHLTTTIFASSGMKLTTFVAAAICSLPKQLITVYIGVLLAESVDGTSRKDKIISITVAVVCGIITSFALKYVNKKMDEVTPELVYERRKARQTAHLKALSEGNDVV